MRRVFRWHNIPHYYGDYVRTLFVVTAALGAVAVPLVGDLLQFGLFLQVLGILLLVLLAGLTHPHGRLVLVYDTVVSGLGMLLLEYAAVSLFNPMAPLLFAAREAAALLLLVAFYYSVKTIRAMTTHQVGQAGVPGEFDDMRG